MTRNVHIKWAFYINMYNTVYVNYIM